MHRSLEVRHFGTLPTGESVEAWTLHGSGGFLVEAITYGGIVTRVLAPDREGRLADVVLGFDHLDSYVKRHPYFGAIVGRVAGRMPGGRFTFEGEVYDLARNDPPNHLHGGLSGFDRKIWKAVPVERSDGSPSLRLYSRSPHGEEGYPGTVDITVTYTVTADNTFIMETEAVTDRPTLFSTTHHGYFNLGGEGSGTISSHELQIHADAFVSVDEEMTLLGRAEPVSGGNDFRKPRILGEAIPHLFRSHGDLYRVRQDSPSGARLECVPAASLVHPESGRVLSISTTQTFLQLYTGVALDGSFIGKSGARYESHAGLCLECEEYPACANSTEFRGGILFPGQKWLHATACAFLVLE